ncbi:MAG: 30S ribosomal protein S20 [Bacteriovoracaceae bacterium]
MANHKSSVKRAKQTIKKTATNRAKTSKTKSAMKDLRTAIASGKKDEAKTLLTKVQSFLGKLGKSKAMNKKTAARKTGRLATSVSKM